MTGMAGRWSRRTRLCVSGLVTCLLLFIAVGNLATLLPKSGYLPLFFVFLAIFGSAIGFATGLVYKPKKRRPRRAEVRMPVTPFGRRVPG